MKINRIEAKPGLATPKHQPDFTPSERGEHQAGGVADTGLYLWGSGNSNARPLHGALLLENPIARRAWCTIPMTG